MKNEKTQKQKQSENLNRNEIGSSYESNIDTAFFYTNDKFLLQLDYFEILSCMSNKFENLNQTSPDALVKKTILQMLDDEQFIADLLRHYNITIYDLFKIIFKGYPTVFKGPFLKKIRCKIQDKTYINAVRTR